MGKTIYFMDRSNRKFRLLIDGGGTELTGGAVTFETQEDANADMFLPVRCQTGTFRYLGTNDHSDWLSLIPQNATDKPVELQRRTAITNETYADTVWQGYIQPQVFENEYPGNGLVEHEFAVQCPLSVLDTIDIDPTTSLTINENPTITFGDLLQTYIFGRLPWINITNYYIQGSPSVCDARLAVKVMWANFLETDSNGNVQCKYTCRQVLEEFCKFFGYTCRMVGTFVYFTQPTSGNASATFTSYTSLLRSGTSVNRASFTITDAMIADNNNHEEVHPGIGKATVRSNINMLDNLVEIPYDELFDQYNVGIPANPIAIRSVDWYSHNIYQLISQPTANGSSLSYDNDVVSLQCVMTNAPANNGENEGKQYCRFLVYDDSDVGEYAATGQQIPESKESFGWRKCIEIFRANGATGNSNPMFTIASKQMFVISDGYLYVNFRCHQVSAWIQDEIESPARSPFATARLGIGNQYWNGSAWVTVEEGATPPTFLFEFTSAGARTNRTSVTDPQYRGHGFPVTNTMRGMVTFSIIDVATFTTMTPDFPHVNAPINGFLPLMDFEIGFVRGTVEDTKHRGNEYTSQGGRFTDEVNVDLIWASDVTYGTGTYTRHMPAGIGYILDANDKPKATVPSMSGSSVIPEQELASLIANYGSTTHRVVKLNLRESVVRSVNTSTITPLMVCAGSIESGLFPLAISHNWRDDVVSVALIQI